MSLPFKENDLILFTGDSITDCGRDRNDPASLGMGYAAMAASRLWMDNPELKLQVRNTGIGGDSTCHLLARWDEDCIDLNPDWVSIMIGVNNTWRRYDSNDSTPDNLFEAECRELLDRIKNETSARIILCSPFLLHIDESIARMREDLDPKIAILKRLAGEFNALWVDFDAAFVAAQQHQAPSLWAEDGVHPTDDGHALMAETWLNAVTFWSAETPSPLF
ncbi:MAG: SGNH/GDSL hydrolase family protein [Verrucomicrobiota bacterium]